MVCKVLAYAVAVAVAVTSIGRASAWNNTGHQLVALLAYNQLDDKVKLKVKEILKDHPDFAAFLEKANPNVDANPRIVMNAATWPDWARTNHKSLHRGTWHYVNKPFILPDTDEMTRNDIEAEFSNPNHNHGDILKIIRESKDIVKKHATTKEEKINRALRLSWLFHLVGDLHQPLHAIALCTKALPGGDRGGNLIWVTPKHHRVPAKLHGVWDHALGNLDADAIAGVARDIEMKITVAEAARKETDVNVWADESVKLAKSDVYFFNKAMIDFVISTGDEGPSMAPPLPNGYEDNATAVARQRVAVAGARLAEALKATLQP